MQFFSNYLHDIMQNDRSPIERPLNIAGLLPIICNYNVFMPIPFLHPKSSNLFQPFFQVGSRKMLNTFYLTCFKPLFVIHLSLSLLAVICFFLPSFCSHVTDDIADRYRVALNFCGSLILRIGEFWCFAGTNFCDLKRLVFLAGN